ncbi:HET-domain-containing protein [Colletotrichum scovillei]|uniref:HET-domain-containing protein n=1 Tax=Colletotrichum scovillei TaxID=1209932 RepID=A0A9P7R601_9PEZI|nr:HET-domain-containing protein [Colletotrichum scovillei]KAG7069054.1 HET-domain-containing protein [Colletotrichum scovillei]KAG7073008.1 HET-domain-containing protein [Colletotrichum scovillei]
MRLLHTTTFKLREFSGTETPPYGILSHTWGRNEFTFRDFQRAGYRGGITKIDGMCRVARDQRLSWVWIDTCCIDKSSSTELSEAINSMFAWYRQAATCFVYLEDVPGVDNESFDMNSNMDNFASALGSKTNINFIALTRKFEDVHQSFSVAEKMSWASRRETTRLEDKAYSLMGLFDVNMPLLYGEGEKAFFRLQEEIIKKTDDESIFSWGYGEPARFEGGLFAKSPADFLGCRNSTSGKNCIAIPLYYVGNLIIRPPGAVPLLIDEADLGTKAIYLYIHVSGSFDSFKTDFPMPGHMLRRVEKSTTVQFTSAPGNVKLAEMYPPSWYPLCTTSKSLIVVQDLASPTTSATVWMRFWDLSSGLDFALRLDLEWELVPSQRSDQLGLALVSVRLLVKLIPQDMYLFDEVFHNGLSVSEWEEKISWGDGELGASWAQDVFDSNIRLTLPPSKGDALLTKKSLSAEEARRKAARGLKR